MDGFLTGVPRPEVADGGHRAELKGQLLHEAAQPVGAVRTGAHWRRRIVWACVAAVAVGGIAWAAETVVKTITLTSYARETVVTVTGTQGPVLYMTGRSGPTIAYQAGTSEEDLQKAVAQQEEIQKLIAEKRYELVSVDPGDCYPSYVYRFTLSDGSVVTQSLNENLDSTLTDAQKAQEEQDQRDRGEGELVAVSEMQSGGLLYTHRYVLSDGSIVTVGGNDPYLGTEEATYDEVRQLFEAGKGELRYQPIANHMYSYLFVLSDGKRIVYWTYTPQDQE